MQFILNKGLVTAVQNTWIQGEFVSVWAGVIHNNPNGL